MITFVSGNPKKIEEFRQIVGDKIKFESRSLDLPELQGDPIEIATEKCRAAAKLVDGPVIVEDVSLCFNALGGLPGPYIKCFLEKVGPSGLVKMLEGFEDKSAYAQCIYAFSRGKDETPEIFIGKTEGSIIPVRTPSNFGCDSIFVPDDCDGRTFSEMTKEEKCAVSYRFKAIQKLLLRLEPEF